MLTYHLDIGHSKNVILHAAVITFLYAKANVTFHDLNMASFSVIVDTGATVLKY